ncbi:class IV lanthionine synthetase LanL [Kitasatospora sp. NPDC002227]|uniref:class IV lanthionine synthetase LanL n=1 Tax=Kitasatospora sp. NPDC002227 TaxID=3154773 RepID=UPI0033253297
MADQHHPGDPCAALYPDLVEAILRRLGGDDWHVTPGEFWCWVAPAGTLLRSQGWKLHVSATPLSAPMVLARVVKVLAAERAAFKFAGTPARLTELVSARHDRAGGGKFITVYPEDDEQFRRLAEALDHATGQLPGPGILSGRPYRPGSLVHYRYGAFGGSPRLTNDGVREVILRTPDGGYVRDRRTPGFAPPAWAETPFALPGPRPATPGVSVLLNERYVVRHALRHAYKGGVYVGEDQLNGQQVVIKEARHHVGAGLDGTDAVDLLRHEAEMLTLLAVPGLAPAPLDLFEQGGNHYLVQESVPGRTLRAWTAARLRPPVGLVARLAGQVTELVRQVHARGLVLRDLNPNNLMVTPDDTVRLIDLETCARPGDRVRRVHTAGYTAPEVAAAEPGTPAPAQSSDLYSLGAVLFHLVTGTDPVFAPDRGGRRTQHERLSTLLDAALAERPELMPFEPLVLALTAERPEERWSPAQVSERLCPSGGRLRVPGAPARPAAVSGGAPEQRERLLADAVTHLLDTMTPDADDRLWPTAGAALLTDPLNVQHGAAGVLAALTAAAAHRPDVRLRAGVATAAGWLADHADRSPQYLPGLYFGRSGTAWALLDAALLLDDQALAARAARLARRVPVRWPSPDVCHGVAGAGLTQLHFWQATGAPEYRARAEAAAEHLLAAAAPGRSGLLWPVPQDFDSVLAGAHHLGYGHGVAGVGDFLLLAGQLTDRPDFLAAAEQAGQTLLATAQVREGAAGWPVDDRNPHAPVHAPHWCSGAAGIGGFLLRLWQATGDERHRTAAEQAAEEVHRWRWRASPAACHGLTGHAGFLLDLADALAEPRYRAWAEELVACAHARHVLRDGLMLLPDDSLATVTPGYQTGLAGPLALLVRLRHGGTGLWRPSAEAAHLELAERR